MRLRSLMLISLLIVLAAPAAYADARADAKAQVGFGIAVAQQGLWHEAQYRFERAVAIDPTYAPAYNNLAVAYEQQGLIAKAREAYEKAMALAPRSELIRQNFELFEEVHARTTRGNRR